MRIRQAVKAPGFDPGREGTLFTLVQIQHPQFWTRQVLQNGNRWWTVTHLQIT